MNERVSSHGGTRPKLSAELRSPLLRRFGDRLVEQALDRLRLAQGGAVADMRGEDLLWHLNFLDAALATGEPSQFRQYATWTMRFLRARGIQPASLAASFQALSESLEDSPCPPDLEAHRRIQVEVLSGAAQHVREAC